MFLLITSHTGVIIVVAIRIEIAASRGKHQIPGSLFGGVVRGGKSGAIGRCSADGEWSVGRHSEGIPGLQNGQAGQGPTAKKAPGNLIGHTISWKQVTRA